MTQYKMLVDKRWLAIGKPLPFSIYDSQRKLLLAQGHVVESDRSLQRLLDHAIPALFSMDSPSMPSKSALS